MPNIVDARPFGTLEQLKALHRDPMAYACCAEPDPKAGKDAVMGCAAWHGCKWKGKHPTGRVGPANKGTSLLKSTMSGPAMRNAIMPCYDYVPMRDTVSLNGGVLDVIAEEGEVIELPGSRKVLADPLKGIANEYWEDFPAHPAPGANMVTVPDYPRIENQPKLKMVMKLEERRKQVEAQEEDRRRKGHLGMNQVILTPEVTSGTDEIGADKEAIGTSIVGHEAGPEGAVPDSNVEGHQEGTGGSNPDKPAGRKRPRYGAD